MPTDSVHSNCGVTNFHCADIKMGGEGREGREDYMCMELYKLVLSIPGLVSFQSGAVGP